MARKSIFSSNDIINAAFNVVRNQGIDKLTANSIASELKSSTMPIYSYLKSMKKLEEKIVKKGIDMLLQYQAKIRTGDTLIDMGVGYILFARDEKNLFKCINNEKYAKLNDEYNENEFDSLPPNLSTIPQFNGMSEPQKRKTIFTMGVLFQGLAILIIKRFNSITEQEITIFLTETKLALWNGFNVILEAKKNEWPETASFSKIAKSIEMTSIQNKFALQTAKIGVMINKVGIANNIKSDVDSINPLYILRLN